MDSLARQLDSFADALVERTDPRNAAALCRIKAGQCASFAALTPRGVGESAPEFLLPDQQAQLVSLSERLASGSVVLVFVRGGWCPFCTLTLRAWQRARAALTRTGADVIAISPQTSAENRTTAEASGLEFSVLADSGNTVARSYGLVWTLDEEMRGLYARLGHDIPRLTGTGEWELPITAGYVIGPDRRIAVAHLDPRVSHRLEPKDALAAVRSLQVASAT